MRSTTARPKRVTSAMVATPTGARVVRAAALSPLESLPYNYNGTVDLTQSSARFHDRRKRRCGGSATGGYGYIGGSAYAGDGGKLAEPFDAQVLTENCNVSVLMFHLSNADAQRYPAIAHHRANAIWSSRGVGGDGGTATWWSRYRSWRRCLRWGRRQRRRGVWWRFLRRQRWQRR